MWPVLAGLLRLIAYQRLPIPAPTPMIHVAVDGATVPFPLVEGTTHQKPTGAHVAYVAYDTPPLVPLISLNRPTSHPVEAPNESWLENWAAVLVEPVHSGKGDPVERYHDAVSRRRYMRHTLYGDGTTEETPCSPNLPAEALAKVLRYVVVYAPHEVVFVLTERPDALLHLLMLIRRLEHFSMPLPVHLILRATDIGDIPVYAVYEGLREWFHRLFPSCREPLAHACLIAQIAQERQRLGLELWLGYLGFFANYVPFLPIPGSPPSADVAAPKESVTHRQHLFQGFLDLDSYSTASLAYHVPERWEALASTWMHDALARSVPGASSHGKLELLARAEALRMPVKLMMSTRKDELNRAVFSSLNYLSLAWFVEPTYYLWLRDEAGFHGYIMEAKSEEEIARVVNSERQRFVVRDNLPLSSDIIVLYLPKEDDDDRDSE